MRSSIAPRIVFTATDNGLMKRLLRTISLLTPLLALESGISIGSGQTESWGNQIFLSKNADARACELGRAQSKATYNQQNHSQGDYVSLGQVTLRPPQGELAYFTRYSDYHFYCFVAEPSIPNVGLKDFKFTPASKVWISDQSVKAEQISVYILLEKDGKESLQIEPATVVKDSPRYTIFEFRTFSDQETQAIEVATSFTILVNRGSGEERYPISPLNLPLLEP